MNSRDAIPRNQIVHGDCLDELAGWPDGYIDLAYLDPPFNTGSRQTAIAGSYPDSWDTMPDYLAFMRPRLAQIRRVLSEHGAILVHCDWRTSHHLRLLLDDLFGASSFVNHLIWKYGLGGSSPRRFARKHDDILFYVNGPKYFFEPPMVAATSNRMQGKMKKATDVLDIPSINNMALERTGYPTQKPIALLELLVRACCPAGGRVLDPFCGSGTTLEAAQRTGRAFVGIDVNPEAIAIARHRVGVTSEPERPAYLGREL